MQAPYECPFRYLPQPGVRLAFLSLSQAEPVSRLKNTAPQPQLSASGPKKPSWASWNPQNKVSVHSTRSTSQNVCTKDPTSLVPCRRLFRESPADLKSCKIGFCRWARYGRPSSPGFSKRIPETPDLKAPAAILWASCFS